jgi:hypothetical protein
MMQRVQRCCGTFGCQTAPKVAVDLTDGDGVLVEERRVADKRKRKSEHRKKVGLSAEMVLTLSEPGMLF